MWGRGWAGAPRAPRSHCHACTHIPPLHVCTHIPSLHVCTHISSPPRLPLSHCCHSGGFSPTPPALCSMRLLEPFSPTEQPCAPPVVGPDASCRGAEPLPALSLPRRPPRFAQLRSAPFPSAADVGALPSLPHLGEEERRAGAAQPLRPRGAPPRLILLRIAALWPRSALCCCVTALLSASRAGRTLPGTAPSAARGFLRF